MFTINRLSLSKADDWWVSKRWNSPSLGMVSPGEFVPIAEDMGLIVPIGGWVLEEACRQMMEWKAAESRFQDVTINVNLSCRQLAQPGIVADISAVLARTGLDRAMLQLEVTEIAIIRNPEAGAALLAELRHCGVKMAIDDFGTGYSSLAYLHRLPLDALKIDRSFVDKMTLSEDNRAIVGTIITLADRLNLAVVAEGIETPEQRKLLQERGCEFAQAILFFSADPGRKRVDD
jgi:EAL domain-containing protein (putative c-di-GMP-specific phosphodiesterase class I)